MIIFGAIAPHSPLLLPTIGKKHQSQLTKTTASYKILEEELYAAKPDVLVVFSPHGTILKNAFSLFIAPRYRADLSEFGDLVTALEFRPDMQTIQGIRQLRSGKTGVAIAAVTEKFIDYGTAIPLALLTAHLPDIGIIPFGTSSMSAAEHFSMGEKLGVFLHKSTRRIAIVASADLAQTLTDAAPGGFSLAGKKFDEAIVQYFRKNEPQRVLTLERRSEAAKSCGLRPIALLLGALAHLQSSLELLSYEAPFGVGYLTVHYTLN